MAARRSSSSRTSRSRRAAQSQSPNVGMIVGVAVVAIGVLAAIMMMKKGDEPQDNGNTDPAAHAKEKSKEDDWDSGKESTSTDPDKGLKDPEIPPPSISSSVVATADKLYDEAKVLHDDARRAQSAGDSKKFNELINDSWDKLQAIEEALDKYTTWLEEADMGDWKLPSNYKALQTKLAKYDKLSGRVKRIKPNRR